MKKIMLCTLFMLLSVVSYGQYRWEVTGGATFSNLSLEDTETSSGTGFYVNAGYGYLMGVRAHTSIVFSLELLQRSSTIKQGGMDVKAETLQVGFNPKFRYLFNTGKDRFRPFINVGPSIRLNTSFKVGDEELEAENGYEQLIIGGVYGVGFSQMIGELFDIVFEAGVMNDFIDNIIDTESKFFDVYARVGVRFRIYDARR